MGKLEAKIAVITAGTSGHGAGDRETVRRRGRVRLHRGAPAGTARTGTLEAREEKVDPDGTVSSRTMIVMTTAITPSVNASRRAVSIVLLGNWGKRAVRREAYAKNFFSGSQ
jgi:hypothetical protein